jgi:hypothetical protein
MESASSTGEGGDRPLDGIAARLEELADRLARVEDGGDDDEEAAALVREASELAAQAGRELDRALRSATESRET